VLESVYRNKEREMRDSKDSIAKPLYALISQVFSLKGAFKILRKTLVHVVQVTYGKSINRYADRCHHWFLHPLV